MTQDGFPLLDEFGIPEGGVCGLFSEAAIELMQTDDPKRPVGQENMEQQELTVQTSDAAPITHASFDRTAMRKQTVSLEELGLAEEVVELPEYMQQEAIQKALEICPWASRTEFVEGGIMCFESHDDADTWERQANAGGGLESNDVVAPDGLPTKAEDEQGGQDMQNRENVLSMRFPDFNDLSENERFSARLAVMTDSDIAETPIDVLFDALDTIDNRRSGAEPTLEQEGYKTKILEELKNRGVERKKAEADDDPGDYVSPVTPHGTVDEQVYQGFLNTMRNTGAQSMQEEFDVMAREMGLGGMQINEIAERLTADGFEVVAGRRPFPVSRGKVVKQAGIQVFDNGGTTADRYTVIIDGSLYTMSENAMQANGVNMYAGETSEGLGPETGDQEISVDELPDEVKRAIEIRKQGSIRMAAMTPAEMQEEIVYIAGMLENGGTPEVSLNNIPSYLRVQAVNADKLNATVLSRALEQVAQGLDNGGTTEQAYEDFKEWMGMNDTEGEQPTFGSKRTARFTVSPPYHGESGSLWYIVDENADPVDSAHSKEEAEALKEQYESGEKTAKKVRAFGEKYPELDEIVLALESEVIDMINTRTQGVESEMPYKAQYVLEVLIQKLQADV